MVAVGALRENHGMIRFELRAATVATLITVAAVAAPSYGDLARGFLTSFVTHGYPLLRLRR
jgi:hypothetical protein